MEEKKYFISETEVGKQKLFLCDLLGPWYSLCVWFFSFKWNSLYEWI